MAFWRDDVGLPGFYPFDWIAAAYLVDPTAFDCTLTNARLAREWAFWALPRRGLLVGPDPDDLTVVSGQILYCPRTAARVHAALLAHP